MRAVVVLVKSLPDGRRVAKFEAPGLVGLAFLESEMGVEMARELEEIIQATLDGEGWNQNWDWAAAAMMAAAQHARAS